MTPACKFLLIFLAYVAMASSSGAQGTTPPTKKPSAPQSPSVVDPQLQVRLLEKEAEALRQDVALLRATVSSLQRQVWQLQFKVDAYKKVTLDLAVPDKFQRIDNDNGSFLISVENATQYLDGYRVVLRIGNPYAASYAGFTLNARWGKRLDMEKFDPEQYQQWEKQVRSKEFSFTERLLSGRWNRVEMIFPATAGDQLGFLEVTLSTPVVSLIRE